MSILVSDDCIHIIGSELWANARAIVLINTKKIVKIPIPKMMIWDKIIMTKEECNHTLTFVIDRMHLPKNGRKHIKPSWLKISGLKSPNCIVDQVITKADVAISDTDEMFEFFLP